MSDVPFHEWTPCEMHGHRFSFEDDPDEVYDTCVDCGEPRCDD